LNACKLLAIENCSAISKFSLQFAVEEIKKKIQGALLSDKSTKEIKPRNGTILKRHIKQL
jgi:hypothetical protein